MSNLISGREHLDLNKQPGFYLSLDYSMAVEWLQKKVVRQIYQLGRNSKEKGAILIFKVPDFKKWVNENGFIGFDNQDFAWYDIIKYYRNDSKIKGNLASLPRGLKQHVKTDAQIDYLVGPMARNFKKLPEFDFKLRQKTQLCIKTQRMADEFTFIDKVLICERESFERQIQLQMNITFIYHYDVENNSIVRSRRPGAISIDDTSSNPDAESNLDQNEWSWTYVIIIIFTIITCIVDVKLRQYLEYNFNAW